MTSTAGCRDRIPILRTRTVPTRSRPLCRATDSLAVAARILLRAMGRWDCWLAAAADDRMSATEKMMVYRGHIKNGKIMLDEPVQLPEGAEVSVEVRDNCDAEPALWDKLRGIAGTVEGPEDWARNHDHYIHGATKKP